MTETHGNQAAGKISLLDILDTCRFFTALWKPVHADFTCKHQKWLLYKMSFLLNIYDPYVLLKCSVGIIQPEISYEGQNCHI